MAIFEAFFTQFWARLGYVGFRSDHMCIVNSILKTNKSVEIKKVHNDLYQYTSSYITQYNNKDIIVQKLLSAIDQQIT